jgi:hypothetical protein
MDGPRHRNSPATRKLNYKDYSLRWVTTKATKSFAPDEPHNRVVSLMTSTILETKSSLLLKILLFLSHQIDQVTMIANDLVVGVLDRQPTKGSTRSR